MKRYQITIQPLSGATSLLKSQVLYALGERVDVLNPGRCPYLYLHIATTKEQIELLEQHYGCVIEIHHHESISERTGRHYTPMKRTGIHSMYANESQDDVLESFMEYTS